MKSRKRWNRRFWFSQKVVLRWKKKQKRDGEHTSDHNKECMLFLGHRSKRLQWPIVIMRCPSSVVRPSVDHPLDYLHFQLLLQNRLMGLTSGFQGSMNVHRGALLLVPQWQCISSFVFYIDETWYGWSTQGPLQVLLFFGQIHPGADPGRGQNRSWGSPSSKNFFFRTKGYNIKPNA